ncbi:MAG: hypothetical protein JNJ55_13235, partial [Betaproteobacteria bacterium]|nr:hypothetical protein [Betaproteobacteria bacterium]
MKQTAESEFVGEGLAGPSIAASMDAAERAMTAGDLGALTQFGYALHGAHALHLDPAARQSLQLLTTRCLALCRRLYACASASVAIPYALASNRWADSLGDPALQQRTLTACGLLMADIGNVVRAIEYHMAALSLAKSCDNAIEASRTWTNIGACFSVTGNDVLAARCFDRALEAVENNPDPLHSRFAALCNLSLAHFHLGEYAHGLVVAERALHEAVAGMAP